ncbi:MAG: hypothetical protein E7260_04240 [Lachnospiraceae bacterium]|nr:hypothetical protein [Lachnospiraceae bacterium]
MGEYINFLDEIIERLKKEEEELVKACRKDEANFIRVKRNICDICKTIYNVVAGLKSGEELREEYIRRLTKLSEDWRISLEKAREHGNIEKIIIEETKLEILQRLKAKFEEVGE